MRVYILEQKTFDFEALLDFIPNRPEPIGDGEVEKHPLHSQRFRAIADYIIKNHNADIRSYAAVTGTFDKRQLEIVENWDYRKAEALDLTKTDRGLKVRDGRHRCIIIAVMVLTQQIAYQPVDGEIHDFQNYVDTTQFYEFFQEWVLQFERNAEYKASLRIYFNTSEIHKQDLAETVCQYGLLTKEMLLDIHDVFRKRITPLKLVGVCREVSKDSERFDVTL